MIRLFCLVCTSFYDDFCQLELLDLVESASDTALSLLELLGWEVAKGDKLKGFADAFNMLGARISFAEVPKGLVMVSNKPGRLEDIEKLLGAMAARGKGALDLVPSLKGKLLFAASHVFGKCSQIAIQAIRQCETGVGHMSEVSSVVRLAERALALLRLSGPRTVSLWSQQPPVVVYTDGACEAESITTGAVLVDLSSGTKEFFGCPVPEALVLKWRRSGRTQLIFFTEILPVLVAKKTWSEILKNRRVFFYIDNEAAKAALIRGFSPLLDASDMLFEIFEQDVLLRCLPWYSRVPSKSNCADAAWKPHSAQAAHKRAKSWGRGSFGFGSFLLGSLPWLCFH